MRWLTARPDRAAGPPAVPAMARQGRLAQVWDYDRQLTQQKDANRKLEVRNGGLDAEVRDLKQGYGRRSRSAPASNSA